MTLDTKISMELDALYSDFSSQGCQDEDLLSEQSENFEDELISEVQPKTFSSIAKEDDILQMYLKDVGKIKLLNSKEEKLLGKDIKEGELKKQKLQNENLFRQIYGLLSALQKIHRSGRFIHGSCTGRLAWINKSC